MNKEKLEKEKFQQYLKKLLEEGKTTEFIKEILKEIGPKIIDLRNELHENPELGGEEYETIKRVKERLEKLENVEILGNGTDEKTRKKYGNIGLVARIKGKEGGPTIALRADMDALPIEENPSHPHASKIEGKMHACGHDAHTAALVGAAEILNELAKEGKLDGNVLLLFQTSEERTVEKRSGAVRMIRFLEEEGLRKDIDAIFGFHVYTGLERGKVRVKEGIQNASSGDFEVLMQAPGGHIMDSYKLPNINELLAKIIARINKEYSPQEPAPEPKDVLVASASTHFVGKVGYNVMAREGWSEWVLRIFSQEYKTKLKEILETVKKAIEEETGPWKKAGLTVSFRFNPGYRPLIHRHPEMVNLSKKVAKDIIGENVEFDETPTMGGEDFSFYLEEFRGKEIPGTFVMVGAANPEKGIPKCSHHQKDFQIDEEVIPEISALYVKSVLEAIEYFKKRKNSNQRIKGK